jgi:hypothetical protein
MASKSHDLTSIALHKRQDLLISIANNIAYLKIPVWVIASLLAE